MRCTGQGIGERGLAHGASRPSLGAAPIQLAGKLMCSQTGKLLKSHSRVLLSNNNHWLLVIKVNFQTFSPPQRSTGEWGWKWCFFWQPASILKLSRDLAKSCLIRVTKSLRKIQTFLKFCARNQGKDQIHSTFFFYYYTTVTVKICSVFGER